ncbi:DHH family phosphoesterase [Furfurilactobacillus curtus]|uniref:Cyclic-di-AMP phosphodiesterase n=1 Tax=Furfurilactobacillus curtus TaxID=1746200 RepID=A0ABQ5JMC3_9LACO
MRQLFAKLHLPVFMQNTRLRWVAGYGFALGLLSVIIAFMLNWIFGLVMLLIVLVLLVLVFNTLQEISIDTQEFIADLSYRIKRGEQEALIEMPMGILIFNEHQRISWINPYLQTYFGEIDVLGKTIAEVSGQLAEAIEAHEKDGEYTTITWADKQFYLLVQPELNVVYLMDVSHYAQIERDYHDEQLVLGMISLDNYDEVTQSMNDSDVSTLRNYVTSTLTDWTLAFNMYLRRLSSDRYLILGHLSDLEQLETDKFKILDTIRETTSKQNYPLTLSLGIAYGQKDLNRLATLSQSNLDLALGRGGDQVVVKAEDAEARFYGGKTNPMEKRTRVRARMISQALQELFSQSDQIFVAGHQSPDMDSLGACLGIRRIAQMNGKKCWIILDEAQQTHSDIQRLLTVIEKDSEIQDAIITPVDAANRATDQSLLIMVDHSKPSLSMGSSIYEPLQNRTVIIDHHRRGEEFPENPLLVYIEPYASSTCELITEMLEYQPQEANSINRIEATAMLSGIEIDTKHFTDHTGTRTFDAASYLRSAGADAELIAQFNKENPDSYMERNHLISRVELINDNMALIAGEDSRPYDSVTAAQAADSLLSMSGIDASFVITQRSDGRVGVSARSTGEVNVQVIMEQMGGGGHLQNAATQIEKQSVSDVRQTLVDLLINQTDDNPTEAKE